MLYVHYISYPIEYIVDSTIEIVMIPIKRQLEIELSVNANIYLPA